MAEEFTPITTQEALDNVLKERLNRQNEKHSKEMAEVREQFSDYDELKASREGFEAKLTELEEQLKEANEKLTGYDSQIAEKDKAIEEMRLNSTRMKIATEFGLPNDAIDFLHGTSEEEIRDSAERLSSLAPKRVAPLSKDEREPNSHTKALKQLLTSLE